MFNLSIFTFLEEFFFVKKNEVSFEIFENIFIFEMKISKLMNYLLDMC
jgi:hypothetical protein